MQDTRVRSLGQEDALEKEMATHSSIVAWRILWREEPGKLQSLELLRVGHNLTTKPPPDISTALGVKYLFFSPPYFGISLLVYSPNKTQHLSNCASAAFFPCAKEKLLRTNNMFQSGFFKGQGALGLGRGLEDTACKSLRNSITWGKIVFPTMKTY